MPFRQAFDENKTEIRANDSIYDIDKTIRVIHELDQSIICSDNLDDYLIKVSNHDYRNLAPEVPEAKKKFLRAKM
jgi:type I restriction-modification system DNA methylase subunit